MRPLLCIISIVTLMTVPILTFGQRIEEKLSEVEQQLKTGQKNVKDILQDDGLMPLHSHRSFRDMIKWNAPVGNITIVTPTEVGTPITVSGIVLDKSKNPVRNALVYMYQTSDAGWYSDSAAHILLPDGDMLHARLFGYVRTDDQGKFLIQTIKPQGSPKSSLAANVKIQIWDQDMQPLNGPGELQFEDDPRMTWPRRKQSLEDGFLISKNTGTADKPLYQYVITVR